MNKRIVIIGGGVIGLSTAYYCAKRGMSVTVIERNGAQRDGCSFGNAGMIVPSHFIPLAAPGMVALGLKWMWNPASPFYIKPRLDSDLISWGMKFWRAATSEHVSRAAPLLRDLSLASRECFEDLAEDPGTAAQRVALHRSEVTKGEHPPPTTPSSLQSCNPCSSPEPGLDFGLVKKGLLMLCKEQHTLDDEAKTATKSRELGIPAEVLNARQVAALDPGARLDIAGAVYFPKDCHLVPSRFMAALQSEIERLDGKFVWDNEVVDWKIENRRIRAAMISDGNEVKGDEFVLCCGTWSPLLARKLFAKGSETAAQRTALNSSRSNTSSSSQTVKLQSGDSRRSPKALLNIPIQAGKGYSLTLPKPRQLPNLCSILCEARVAVTPMDGALRVGGTMEIAGLNLEINPIRVRGIIESFCKYFPDFLPSDFDGIQPWRGLRPCSPDGLPYLGRTAKFDNLSLATGHAMMGLSLGPATGKLMGEILSGEKPSMDIAMLSPDRFG